MPCLQLRADVSVPPIMNDVLHQSIRNVHTMCGFRVTDCEPLFIPVGNALLATIIAFQSSRVFCLLKKCAEKR